MVGQNSTNENVENASIKIYVYIVELQSDISDRMNLTGATNIA